VPLAEEATCRTGANDGKPLAITARGLLSDNSNILFDNSKKLKLDS
jgi:hypothetical protein